MKQDFYDKKVIVLDINFLEIAQQNIDEYIYTRKLLLELTANQNVILITDNPSFIAHKEIENLKLKAGYLISDAGVSITNIANQKKIQIQYIDPDIALKICNLCVWNNLHFSLITENTQYPFNLSYWLIKKYQSDLSYLYEFKKNTMSFTPEIKEILLEKPIIRIEIYFLRRDHASRRREMKKFVENFSKEVDHSINLSTLHILPKGFNKLNSVKTIVKTFDYPIEIHKDGIYCSLSQVDKRVLDNCYFSIVSDEIKRTVPEEEISGAEELPIGSVSWIQWFHHHEHLWSGEPSTKMKESLDRLKGYQVNSNSLIAIQNGHIKYLSFEKIDEQEKRKKKEQIVIDQEKLNFWPQQVPQVTALLKKYSWKEKKT